MQPAIARYREYAPSARLRSSVRAFFTFSIGIQDQEPSPAGVQGDYKLEIIRRPGDPLWSNLFADGHLSLVCCVGGAYSVDGLWCPSIPSPHIIGAMSGSHKTIPDAAFVQVGAYFSAGGAVDFLDVPACELTDKVVALESLWSADSIELDERLNEAMDDLARVSALETALQRRLASRRRRQPGFDLCGLAALALRLEGRLSVDKMADMGGVSRQYLARTFRDQVGVNPKLYCRLARFRALLSVPSDGEVNWADSAASAGYADQSHMIAEFRRFSGNTPAYLNKAGTFHPFRWS